jgi:hypothetical protein
MNKIPRELLLIERSKHVCDVTKFFVKNFKHLFGISSPVLFSGGELFRF